ncbi:uncharacterized protein LOC128224333 [Mya arenaria]|uniref:uncharacterized protein LOC128224333 n=1 Tax=Mya arenaria TaxID=6604 RepID=UPI0022E21DCB|nr:uncharacterized protein LOC128224333 [Mya arenaria]XP_052790108.1 uncharacterized protein LOC128224333 [Mya arenaria]XP_052790109.1 uncharacterized protein LOC128224333 [Mya arenaria]
MSDCPQPKGKERGSSKCNCIYTSRVAFICKLANVMLTLAFLALLIVWTVVRAPLTRHNESLACIPCDTIKFNANTNLGQVAAANFPIKQRDDGMCCGPAESITQMMFQKEMAAQYHYHSSGQSFLDIVEEYVACERETNDKQTIAKVVGIMGFKSSYIVDGHHKVLWNKNGRTFYANKCIHLDLEGEIFVRQSGYYIVSSQLNLRRRNETGTPINGTRTTTFIHHLDLFSHKYGTTGMLMQTKNSIERNGVYFTSFLSAVFKLNKYDRLSVSISHPELLDNDKKFDNFLVYYTYDLQN